MAQAENVQEIPESRPVISWRPRIIFAIAGVCLLTLLVVTLYYSNSARRLLTELQQYAWQVDKVDAILIQLLNAESGARGFLVTGKTDYLDPYHKAIRQMDTLLEDIDANSSQPKAHADSYARIKLLIDSEMAALSAAIDARRSDEETSKILMEHGNRTMNAIRDNLNILRSRLATDSAIYFVDSLSFLNNSRWIVVVLFSGVFLLLFGLFLLVQKQVALRSRIALLMSGENERLDKLVKKRTADLTSLASYLTRVSEAEKQRIAQELHDEMGALLTAARMDTTWLMRDLDATQKEKYAQRLHRLLQSIDSAIGLKRKITTDLKPPLLQELGLVESLRAMAENLAEDSSHRVQINLPDSLPAMEDEKALAVFRITQESLTNIRKYARATHVEVDMEVDGDTILIRITDDGQGFDANRVEPGSHGISGMRHRAQMFGGSFKLTSTPGRGTQVRARIPLREPAP
jgi:protein-histidine pros-kinase